MSNSSMAKPWSNVSALLEPDFGIAPDVTFQIQLTEGGPPGEVKAHRLILGFLSPVFRNQFFGPAKDTENNISVQDTNKKAFDMQSKAKQREAKHSSQGPLDQLK